jgi:hypothetical protein
METCAAILVPISPKQKQPRNRRLGVGNCRQLRRWERLDSPRTGQMAAVSRAKCPASRTWTSAFGTTRRTALAAQFEEWVEL